MGICGEANCIKSVSFVQVEEFVDVFEPRIQA